MRVSKDNMLYNESSYKRYCKDCQNYIKSVATPDKYYCIVLGREIKEPMCGFCSWFDKKIKGPAS